MSGNITAVQTGSGWDVDQTGNANLQGDLQPDGSIKLDAKGSAAVAAAIITSFGLYNIKAYGAKCDGRSVTDAGIAAGTAGTNVTLTSATIGFTQADVGKAIAINSNNLTTTWSPSTGTIVSVQSATSATVQLRYTLASPISAPNGSLLVATDDSAALASAISSASVLGGTVVIPEGITLFTQRLDINGRVNFKGVGKGGVNTISKFFTNGSILVYAGPWSPLAALSMYGKSSAFESMTLDVAGTIDGAVQFNETEPRIYNCTIARSAATLIAQYASSLEVVGCELYGQDKGTTFLGGGDAIIKGNYIFGGGSGSPTAYLKNITDDAIITDNHFFRAGIGTTLNNVPGPHIKIEQSNASSVGGGVICANVFDTCEGNAIEILVSSSAGAACEISALSIANNQFYQPQPFTNNTYSCINVKAGDGGSQTAYIRGLSITGNVAKGYPASSRAWKSFINWDIQATYGQVLGDVISGNSANNCNALYTASAAAHTPAYSAGNATIAGVGTTVVVG